jgi:hypothetical protein
MMKKLTIDGSVIITFLLEMVPHKPIPGMTLDRPVCAVLSMGFDRLWGSLYRSVYNAKIKLVHLRKHKII